MPDFEAALEYLLDPVTGSAANNRKVLGVLCLHVDDLLFAGSGEMHKQVIVRLRKEFKVGSEDKDDVMFTGQRIRWRENSLVVDQDKAVKELKEIELDKNMKDDTPCTPELHTEFRSLLGSINWLQSRTQFHIGYRFGRCASASASPTIGDIRALNKVARTIRARPVRLHFWPIDRSGGQDKQGAARIIGYPDASYRNNSEVKRLMWGLQEMAAPAARPRVFYATNNPSDLDRRIRTGDLDPADLEPDCCCLHVFSWHHPNDTYWHKDELLWRQNWPTPEPLPRLGGVPILDEDQANEDYINKASEKVHSLNNQSLWLGANDADWHKPLLVTIREFITRNKRTGSQEGYNVRETLGQQRRDAKRGYGEFRFLRHLTTIEGPTREEVSSQPLSC